MCIREPALYTNAPNIHPISRMTAMTYNNDLIKKCLFTNRLINIVPSSQIERGKFNAIKIPAAKATGNIYIYSS